MLSIRELLNPATTTPERAPALDYDVSSVEASPTEVVVGNIIASRGAHVPRFRDWVTENSRQRGPVNFPPYEDLHGEAYNEVRRFRVRPLGQIRKSCEHIPYNSSKKDFFSKTGREGIEAFSYTFTIPGSEAEYKVLWDYNVGLVRMTPFFKCLGYPKTKPSQMLDKNPGLRDITPSITGGSVSAQGYWMPYHCARAVCATFCYTIAGALIPIFGPSFPSLCRAPGDVRYNDMKIDPDIIQEAARRMTGPHNRNRVTPPQTPRRVSLEPRPEAHAHLGLLSPRHMHSRSRQRHQHATSSWNPINGSRDRDMPPSQRDVRYVTEVSTERWQPAGPRRNLFSSPPPTSPVSRLDSRRKLLPMTPRPLFERPRVMESNSSKRLCRGWDDKSRAAERRSQIREEEVDADDKPAERNRRQAASTGRGEDYRAATTLMGLRRDR